MCPNGGLSARGLKNINERQQLMFCAPHQVEGALAIGGGFDLVYPVGCVQLPLIDALTHVQPDSIPENLGPLFLAADCQN